MKYARLTAFIVVAFIFLCSFSGRLMPGRSDAWIPKDFDPNKCVLLIEKRSYYTKNHKDYYAKETAQLEAAVKKVYPYPFEFVVAPPSETTYGDKSKYPYFLIFGNNYMQSANSNGATIEIVDRKAGKVKPTNGWSYGYRKTVLVATLKQWVKAIQEQR